MKVTGSICGALAAALAIVLGLGEWVALVAAALFFFVTTIPAQAGLSGFQYHNQWFRSH